MDERDFGDGITWIGKSIANTCKEMQFVIVFLDEWVVAHIR